MELDTLIVCSWGQRMAIQRFLAPIASGTARNRPIPFEQFYLLAVLGEEDEYRTTKWRKFHLGSHNLIQAIYAHVHSDISLADVILGVFV